MSNLYPHANPIFPPEPAQYGQPLPNWQTAPAPSDGHLQHALQGPIYPSGVGQLTMGMSPQMQASAQLHQAALLRQLPQIPMHAVPTSVPPPVRWINPPASVNAPPVVPSAQGAQETRNLDTVGHQTPQDKVKVASNAFWALHEKGQWSSAMAELLTFTATMDTLKPPPKMYVNRVREDMGISAEEQEAVDAMKALPPIRGAFLLGACHHICKSTVRGALKRALRFQPNKKLSSIDHVVEHYATHFGNPALRAEYFRATLVQLSWLAPTWGNARSSFKETQEERLSNALKTLSNKLELALGDSEEAKAAFREDLLSAVQPGFCSPLLAPMLAELDVFKACGDRMEANVEAIKIGNGSSLFPGDAIPTSRKAKADTPKKPRAIKKRQRDDDPDTDFNPPKEPRPSNLPLVVAPSTRVLRSTSAQTPRAIVRTWDLPDPSALCAPAAPLQFTVRAHPAPAFVPTQEQPSLPPSTQENKDIEEIEGTALPAEGSVRKQEPSTSSEDWFRMFDWK